MAEDKIKAKASSSGVEVSAEGGAAGRLGHALADALSPFTNALGAAGDYVEDFRVFRRLKLLQTLERAKQLRQSLGIEARPVSPKLLTYWMEKASLESDKDEVLTEMWAKLLASSGEEFSSIRAICIDIIGKLSSEEAIIFQEICEIDQGGEDYLFDGINYFETDPIKFIEETLIMNFGGNISGNILIKEEDNIIELIKKSIDFPGVKIISLHMEISTLEVGGVARYTIQYFHPMYNFGREKELKSIDILGYHGLITHKSYDSSISLCTDSDVRLTVEGVSLTQLGSEFAMCIFGNDN